MSAPVIEIPVSDSRVLASIRSGRSELLTGLGIRSVSPLDPVMLRCGADVLAVRILSVHTNYRKGSQGLEVGHHA